MERSQIQRGGGGGSEDEEKNIMRIQWGVG
jgi:hypothetical protein